MSILLPGRYGAGIFINKINNISKNYNETIEKILPKNFSNIKVYIL